MNKNLFRIVFNSARGQRMAVAETAASQGKAASGECKAESNQYSGINAFAQKSSVRLLLVALSAFGAMPMTFAQIIADKNAPASQRPTVLTGAGGQPLVNIQTPSAAGVSRNTYSQFDVQKNGATLNNSRQSNPWLATGEAKVILNEVNSSSPSYLAGAINVNGGTAQVIVANPSGIKIDGTSFVNASRATLTTGTALVTNGALQGFDVRQGTVEVLGGGLDVSNTGYADILSRAAIVGGSIKANELNITTGAQAIEYTNGATTAGTATGPAPAYAIDTSALGGMYAGKISLKATEAGVGVRNAGALQAKNGSLVIAADGTLQNTGAVSASIVSLATSNGDVINSGKLQADKLLIMSSGQNISLNGTGLVQSTTVGTAIQLNAQKNIYQGYGTRIESEGIGSTIAISAGGIYFGNWGSTVIADNDVNINVLGSLTSWTSTIKSNGGNVALTGTRGIDLSSTSINAANVYMASGGLTGETPASVKLNYGSVISKKQTTIISADKVTANWVNLGSIQSYGTPDNSTYIYAVGDIELNDSNITNGGIYGGRGDITITSEKSVTLQRSTLNNRGGDVAVKGSGINIVGSKTYAYANYSNNLPKVDIVAGVNGINVDIERDANNGLKNNSSFNTNGDIQFNSFGGKIELTGVDVMSNKNVNIVGTAGIKVDSALRINQTGSFNSSTMYYEQGTNQENLKNSSLSAGGSLNIVNSMGVGDILIRGANFNAVNGDITIATNGNIDMQSAYSYQYNRYKSYASLTCSAVSNPILAAGNAINLAAKQSIAWDAMQLWEFNSTSTPCPKMTAQNFNFKAGVGDFDFAKRWMPGFSIKGNINIDTAGAIYGQKDPVSTYGQQWNFNREIGTINSLTLTASSVDFGGQNVYTNGGDINLVAKTGDVNLGASSINSNNINIYAGNRLNYYSSPYYHAIINAATDLTISQRDFGGVTGLQLETVFSSGRDLTLVARDGDINFLTGYDMKTIYSPSKDPNCRTVSTPCPLTGPWTYSNNWVSRNDGTSFSKYRNVNLQGKSIYIDSFNNSGNVNVYGDYLYRTGPFDVGGDIYVNTQSGLGVSVWRARSATFIGSSVTLGLIKLSGNLDVTSTVSDVSIYDGDVSAYGAVIINSAKDINIARHSKISSLGSLRLAAAGDFSMIGSAEEISNNSGNTVQSWVNNSMTELTSVNDVSIAGQNIYFKNAKVVSSGSSVSLNALNNITIDASLDKYYKSTSVSGSRCELDIPFVGCVARLSWTDVSVIDTAKVIGSSINAKNINIKAGNDLTIKAGNISTLMPGQSGGVATLYAGNNAYYYAAQGYDYSHGEHNSSNWQGSTSNAATVATSRPMVTTLQSSGVFRSYSGGDQTYQGTQVITQGGFDAQAGVGEKARKDARIILEGVKTTVQTAQTLSNTGLVLQSQSGSGSIVETLTMPSFLGGVKFSAPGGIDVQIPSGDFKTQINTLSVQPGMGFLNDLAQRKDVNWQPVKLAYDKWSYSQEGLSPTGAALLTIAVAAYTGGMGAEVLGSTTALAGGGSVTTLAGTTLASTAGGLTFAGAAVNAGFTSLLTQTAVAMVNNGGDIGKTLSQLASKDSVKNLLSTMVTAGALNELGKAVTVGGVNMADINAKSGFGKDLLKNVTNNVANSVMTAALNGKPVTEKALADSLASALIAAGSGQGAGAIGDALTADDISKFTSKVAHAALGCASGVAHGSACAAGAVGAVIGEMSAAFINPTADPAQREKTLAFAKTMSALAGVIVSGGGDNAAAVNVATATGANAAENNWLGDHQRAAMTKEIKSANSNLDKLKIAGKYLALSTRQDLLTTTGVGMGLADAGWSDVQSLGQFLQDPMAGLDGMKSLLTDPQTRAALGESVVSSLTAKIDSMRSALTTGGDDAALQLGKDLGTLAWQVGTVVTGVGGTATAGAKLVKAGINVGAASLDTMRLAATVLKADAKGLGGIVDIADTGMQFGRGIEGQGKPFEAFVQSKLPTGTLDLNSIKSNFSTFDHLTVDRVAVSTKTLDTSAKTYQKSSAITSTLNGYVDKMLAFTSDGKGNQVITKDMFSGMQMQLGVPANASADQMAAIAQSMQYALSKNVAIVVTKVK